MPLGIDPTVDYAFKRLFADPANSDLLIDLLNAVLPRPPIVDVVILNPFNEKDFADDKLSVLDIKARDAAGTWYNIEVQSTTHWSLPQRLAYYGAVLYCDQLGQGDDYAELTPAITICFLKATLFREAAAPHLRFTLCDLSARLELTDRLQVHTIELPKYNFAGATPPQTERLAQWAFFLTHAAQLEPAELRRLLPQREFVKATGVMEMIAQTPQERMQYEARRKAERDYRSFINDARREGLAEGLERGKEEGLEMGLEKGLEEGLEMGLEEGLEKGVLVGQVQLLQGLLQEPVSSAAELMNVASDALQQLASELKDRLQRRS